LLGCCSYKAMPSTRLYRQQVWCHSSRVGCGGLLKVAQEDFLSSPSGSWPIHDIKKCKTWLNSTQDPSVLSIRSYFIIVKEKSAYILSSPVTK
jgi:hypothetical protein